MPLIGGVLCAQPRPSVSRAGERTRGRATSSPARRRSGTMPKATAWSNTATCWASRTSTRWWEWPLLIPFFSGYTSWHVSFLLFNSSGENKSIQLWLRTQVGSETYWIGLTDQIRENVWEWRDGSTYYEYLSYVRFPTIPTLEAFAVSEKPNANTQKGKIDFFCILPDSGWRASRTTSTMRTAWCRWDTATASGGMRGATSVRNSSASIPTVSGWQSCSVSKEQQC